MSEFNQLLDKVEVAIAEAVAEKCKLHAARLRSACDSHLALNAAAQLNEAASALELLSELAPVCRKLEKELEALRERDCRPSSDATKVLSQRLYQVPAPTDEAATTIMDAATMLLVQARDCNELYARVGITETECKGLREALKESTPIDIAHLRAVVDSGMRWRASWTREEGFGDQQESDLLQALDDYAAILAATPGKKKEEA